MLSISFLWALKMVQRGFGPRQERSCCSYLLWTVNLPVIHLIFAEQLLCVRHWEYSRERIPVLSLPGYTSFLGTFLPLVAETTRVLKDIHWLCCLRESWVDFDFKKHKWLYINNTWKGSFLFGSCLGLLANLPLRNRLKMKDNPSYIFIFSWVDNWTCR